MDRFLNIEVLKHKWHIRREKKHREKRKQVCVRLSRWEQDLPFTPQDPSRPRAGTWGSSRGHWRAKLAYGDWKVWDLGLKKVICRQGARKGPLDRQLKGKEG